MIKQVWSVAKSEYISWVTNPRMFLLGGTLFFIYVFVVERFMEKIDMMNGQLINIFEPYISVLNSPFTILLVPICYLMLMSDFPRIRSNTLFFLYRTGRYKWLMGQILFFAMTILTVLLSIFLVSVLPTMANAYCSNAWSLVTLDFGKAYPDLYMSEHAQLIPDRVFYHIQPFESALFTTLSFFGYFLIIGLTMIMCKLKNFRILGIFISAGIVGLGFATYASKTFIQWVFPMSNTLLDLHYARVLREELFPLWYSILYFPIVVIILLIFTMRSIKRSDFIEGEQL